MDETAVKRGHNYMTMFVDMTAQSLGMAAQSLGMAAQSLGMDERRVIQVEEGKGADTVEKFVHAFWEHNGDTEAVKNMYCDMSPAFIAGVEKHIPEAAITFDGLLEEPSSLFQAAKAKARGYRSAGKRRTIIYLLLGKLQFNLPNPLPT